MASSESPETAADVGECRVDEDCLEQASVCSENRQCVACLRDDDCDSTRPYCKVATDEKKNRCVACQKGTDCGPAGEWECIEEQCFEACDPDADDCKSGLVCVSNQAVRYCAECGPGAPCADPSLVCVSNTCLSCDPTNDTGCAKGEYCERVSPWASSNDGDAGIAKEATRCVECRADVADDCREGVCVDGACTTCDPASNAGCDDASPVCKAAVDDDGTPTNHCVECGAATDCDGHAAGPHCIDNRCAVCDPKNNSGCGEPLLCVNIAPPGVTELYECRECEDSCADGKVCVDFRCVECEVSSDCGSAGAPQCSSAHTCGPCTSNAACEHRSATPWCDTHTGVCVGCLDDDDCADTPETPACRRLDHTCVECTNSSHCPGNPGGCVTFPGDYLNKCAPDGTTPEELGECRRCNAGDCAPGLVCAGESGDSRCLPLAEVGPECDSVELPSQDDAGLVLVCLPEACASEFISSGG